MPRRDSGFFYVEVRALLGFFINLDSGPHVANALRGRQTRMTKIAYEKNTFYRAGVYNHCCAFVEFGWAFAAESLCIAAICHCLLGACLGSDNPGAFCIKKMVG